VGQAIPNFFPILFTVLLAIGMALLLWKAYRRRSRPPLDDSLALEERESLFSWDALQNQLRDALQFRRRRALGLGLLSLAEGQDARTRIRQQYRALLRTAHLQGHGRRRGATPNRYADVLGSHWSDEREAIGQLTSAYYGARYSQQDLTDEASRQADDAYAELERYWQEHE